MNSRSSILGVCLLAGFATLSPAADYTGSATCARCHVAESQRQSLTGHARALAKTEGAQPGQWAFGAGLQATTFVSRLDADNYLEHGESWYRATNTYALTPGHQDASGLRYRIFDPAAGILKCFSCHSTGPLRLGEDDSIRPGEMGVRCEVCHGPGADHAANPKLRLSIPGRRATGAIDGIAMNAACGACHRVLSSAEDTSNLRDPWNSRHQPLLLAASACFQKSNGRLSCITCHSPHQLLETNAQAYNVTCRQCHSGQLAHRRAIDGRACTECHMPAVRPTALLAFANHRIGIYRPEDPLSPIFTSAKPDRSAPKPKPALSSPSRAAKP